jgi:hypothetical protein
MTKHVVIKGNPLGPRADILPAGFDKDTVMAFFAGGKSASNTPSKHAHDHIPDTATAVQSMETARSVLEVLEKDLLGHLDDLTYDTESHIPDTATAAQSVETARSVLEVLDKDLPSHLDDLTYDTGNPIDSGSYGAGAKPIGKGGGDTDKGKGWGKNKTVQEAEPEPEPEPEPTADSEQTTTTTTTTTVEPEPTPELNLGSSDANTYVSGLDTPYGFNIEIVFNGAWTDVLKQGFYDAAEYYSDIITGDLASHNGVDDIQISANLSNIDGSGGFWGWGGTSSVRSDTLLPSKGYVNIDSSDLDTMDSYGLWDDLILHEMAHALGFGTSWASMGLIDNYDGDLRFNGANATQAYNDDYSVKAGNDALSDLGVPVETDGGSGTAGVHWDDQTFGEELMTGRLNYTNTLSDMSIAALEDMGYDTVYDNGQDTTYEDAFLFM